MAEIKSTLDIIMEKTRGLKLTEDEKARLEEKELKGKVHGWVQRYVDGLMDPKGIEQELERLDPEKRRRAADAVLESVLERFDPEETDERLLDLLEKAAAKDAGPLRRLSENFRKAQAERKAAQTEILLLALSARGVSGSAVTPNLEADAAWMEKMSELKEAFKRDAEAAYS